MGAPLLEVENLKVYFQSGSMFSMSKHITKAVDGVSLSISKGETLGVVGESGSGKTTLARAILGLVRPTEGEIYFNGEKMLDTDRRSFSSYIQVVFQDPSSSLNPMLKVSQIVSEPLIVHKLGSKDKVRSRVDELLTSVGLGPEFASRYPHQLSLGQRQRVGIARALAINPQLIILDEPTSSLDVSVQAQILNLLKALQRQQHLTYLFVSHDLAVVRFMSDRVCVMHMGKVVEVADSTGIFDSPKNEYTKLLIDALPSI